MPLSANRERYMRSTHTLRRGHGLARNSTEYYEGQLVCHDGAGRIAPAADTPGFRIAGVCTRRLSAGAATTERVEFEWGHEEWFPRASAITNADLMANAMAIDDALVTDAANATNDVVVGMITELEQKRGVDGAWILIGSVHKDDA